MRFVLSWELPDFFAGTVGRPIIVEDKVKSKNHKVVFDSLRPHGLCSPWNSPGQNIGVGSRSLLQGIFPNQRSNPGLPQCKQILYQLSHQESPRILEWVACPFSRGSSQPRDRTQISHTAGRFFTSWVTRKALGKRGSMFIYMQMTEVTYGILTKVPGFARSPLSIPSCHPHHCTS